MIHVQQYVVGYIIENIAVRVQSNKDVVQNFLYLFSLFLRGSA